MAKKPIKLPRSPSPDSTASKANPRRISSPASTGGAGTYFEQNVNAYWLVQLLVQGIPPILHDCTVMEVHLQTEHLGWRTDDFLIVGQNGSGDHRKLAGQVKRNFTVSATDEECKKAMQDFWEDFKNPHKFAPASDRFTLVTQRGTNALLEHFSGLLDCSRAAHDGAEFERRLATPGLISTKAIQYCNELQAIIGENEGRSLSQAEIWPFLSVLHVLSMDLDTSTRQTEAAIKTLLAYTAIEQDTLGAADASWGALLREVSEGMPKARTFRRDDLPIVVRQRHSPVGGSDQRVLRALSEHSVLIHDGIRSSIGRDLHLGRGRLVQQLLEHLESTQVVLVSGPAGSGKSCIAKDTIGILAADHFVFSFRAEEFAHPHFDETLQNIQIGANALTLQAILAGQCRKVMLVESVERLLEKSTRDAFTDLLTIVARDRSWRLILTCRDYSIDIVRACFLESEKIPHSVVSVPLLDDEELEQVEAAEPALVQPLANQALRRILRNPYILDKARLVHWSEERSLPQSEREFRTLFWRDIVRADHHSSGGMPRRREDTFVQIALQRARALTVYVASRDLDEAAVNSLRHDSLIISSEQSNVLVAPAHDVLEDWAILKWIEDQYAIAEGSVRELSVAIGTHPAVRRTHRKWVTELIERNPEAADRMFQATVRESGLTAQFRDDTLVSLLHSPSSVMFLERHSTELFTNNKQLLWRVIHLLRVACVTTPEWADTSKMPVLLFNMPDGMAWGCILRLVQTHLQSFAKEEHSLLLGFIEDWAQGVSWRAQYPEGAEYVAAIAHWLLPQFDSYKFEGQQRRILRIIAKIPNADRDRFARLLRLIRDSKQERAVKEFQEIIFKTTEGMAAARDMPELIIAAAKGYLLCSESDLRHARPYGSSAETELLFGIKEYRDHGFFPASAYRGPFLPLLRYHSRNGLDFIIGVFNHSADWYARPRVRQDIVEPPFKMELTFEDGSSRTQWCNARLWNLYRGTSVGPDVLKCLLMALERWLLEFAEARPRELDTVLMYILQKSDSAALTSVVASVATAFSQASGESLLVLLKSRQCIQFDLYRLTHESQAPSRLSAIMPRLDKNAVYEAERKEADTLPHRSLDLEKAILKLQLLPIAPQVHEILDRHRAEMPPLKEQDEDDRVWRLALHRMDLRLYAVADDSIEASAPPETTNPPEDGKRSVRLDLSLPDPDIRELVSQSAAQIQAMSIRLDLLMWGIKIFDHEMDARHDPDQWRQKLQEAQRGSVWSNGDEYDLDRGGPGFVAAICVRDRWEEMSNDERDWCVGVICAEIELESDNWEPLARVRRGGMFPDRPCAWTLSILLGKFLDDVQDSRVRHLLVIALTHANTEVRWYAAHGIGKNLWVIDRSLTLRCVNAIATEATLVQQAENLKRNRPYQERRQIDGLEAEAAILVRRWFFEDGAIAEDAYQAMDTTIWLGAEANKRILAILGNAPTEGVSAKAFEQLAKTLVKWWDEDNKRHSNGNEWIRQRDHDTESTLSVSLNNFLLQTSAEAAIMVLQPILDAVDQHPRELYWFVLGLIGAEDRERNTEQFWLLWELFAERVRHASWLSGIDSKHSNGRELMSAILLGSGWKEEVRHWRSLEGHAHHVHSFFESSPPSAKVLEEYLRFLYHVGEQSLPDAFIRIANRLQEGGPHQMVQEENTIFLLVVLLRRYVYGRPLELKRQADLRKAVLLLLDVLVENGSSAAFRMRDDFVTPVAIG